jgi:hypothetical protein
MAWGVKGGIQDSRAPPALQVATPETTIQAFMNLQVVFFKFLLQLAAISERFELESSDWAHFLRLFELLLDLMNLC